jgi:hypothetical protein
MMPLPIRNYVFDKGDLDAFADVAELGGFGTTAFVIMGDRPRGDWAVVPYSWRFN